MSENPRPVGQGDSFDEDVIYLTVVDATATERRRSVSEEQEYKIGPIVGGRSVGVTESDIYDVSVAQTTEYSGQVGDIHDGGEYNNWRYEWGLVVYNKGVLCDESGEPTGIEEGVLPFQVLTYFVDPTGPGYP